VLGLANWSQEYPKRGYLGQFQDTRSLAKIARDPKYLLLGVRRLLFLLTTHRYIGGTQDPYKTPLRVRVQT
jgi:hypothetical protein